MIKETLNWYNGEIFEGKFILGYGIVLMIAALLFFILGNTPAPKSLLVPLIVIGIFFTATGTTMVISNSKKIPEAERLYLIGEKQFIESEIKRVEGFQYLYPMSIVISFISILLAMGLLYFVKNINWQAIAISLMLFGTAFAVIDYFSKERATIYYEQLLLNKNDGEFE